MSGHRRGEDSLELERRKIELEEQLLNLQERRIDIEQKRIELELRMLKLISKSLKKSKSKRNLHSTRDESEEVIDAVGELQDYEEIIGSTVATSDDDGEDYEDGDESDDDEQFDDLLDTKNRKQMKRSNSSPNGSSNQSAMKKGFKKRSSSSSTMDNLARNSKANRGLKRQGSVSDLEISLKGSTLSGTKIRNQDIPTEITKMRNADFPTEVTSDAARRRRIGRRGSAPTGTVEENISISIYNPVVDAMQRQASLRHLDAILKKDAKRLVVPSRDEDQDLMQDSAASVSADSVQTEKRSNKKSPEQSLQGQIITPSQANNPGEALWK
jgi:hypothetical protein